MWVHILNLSISAWKDHIKSVFFLRTYAIFFSILRLEVWDPVAPFLADNLQSPIGFVHLWERGLGVGCLVIGEGDALVAQVKAFQISLLFQFQHPFHCLSSYKMAPAPNPSRGIHKVFPLLLIFLWEYFGMAFFLSAFILQLCVLVVFDVISHLCVSLAMESCFLFLVLIMWIILREGTGKEMSFTGILRLKIAPLWNLLFWPLSIVIFYLFWVIILPCLYFCSFMFYIYCESLQILVCL